MAGDTAPRFPFYAGLWKGFYDRAFYGDVAASWRGRGFAFLALVVVIYSVPAALLVMQMANRFIDEELPYVLPQVPVITVTNGKAALEEGQGTVYLKTREGEVVAKISMDEDDAAADEVDVAEIPLLVDADNLMVQSNGEEVVRVAWYEALPNVIIDQTFLRDAISGVKGWMYFFLLVVTPAMHVLLLLVNALLYALVGTVFARMSNMQLSFASHYQLVMVAQGCALLVVLALRLFAWALGIPATSWVTEMLLVLFFIWYGVRLTREWAEVQERDLPPPNQRF